MSRAQAAVAAAMAARAEHAPRERHDVERRARFRPTRQERLRALGYVASSTQPASRGAAREIPRRRLRSGTSSKTRSPRSARHRPGALATLRKLAAANPDAPVFQTTYARALKEAGQLRARARRVSAGRSTLADRCRVASRSRRHRARRRERGAGRRGGRALREEATRADEAALALDPNSATAHNGLGLLAADEGRPQRRGEGVRAGGPDRPEQRVVLDQSRQRAARRWRPHGRRTGVPPGARR